MVYQNVHDGPNFQWPVDHHHGHGFHHEQKPVTESTINSVVNTIKTIVNSFAENKTESTLSTSTTEANLQQTFGADNTTMMGNNTDQSSFNQMFNSNNTVMTAVTEMMDNNNTIMTAVTEMMDSNNTGIMEMSGSNNTAVNFDNTGMGDVLGTSTEATTDMVTTVVDSVVTTTKAVFNTISESVTPKMGFEVTTQEGDYSEPGHYGGEGEVEEKTLYIVVGVILAAMLLLLVILLVIYKKYKSENRFRSGVYCVNDLNEVSVSSCNQKEVPEQRISKYH